MNVLSLAGTLFAGLLAVTGLSGCEDSRDSEHAALKASCEQHNGDSCSDLSDIYTRGSQDASPNMEQALHYALKGCEYNSGRSCASLGILHAQGSAAMPRDFLKARDYFEKACSLNYLLGCDYLGFQYLKGDGVPQDYQKAAGFFEKACSLGEGQGCYNLASMYQKGVLAANKGKAVYLARLACELNSEPGCKLYRDLAGTE